MFVYWLCCALHVISFIHMLSNSCLNLVTAAVADVGDADTSLEKSIEQLVVSTLGRLRFHLLHPLYIETVTGIIMNIIMITSGLMGTLSHIPFLWKYSGVWTSGKSTGFWIERLWVQTPVLVSFLPLFAAAPPPPSPFFFSLGVLDSVCRSFGLLVSRLMGEQFCMLQPLGASTCTAWVITHRIADSACQVQLFI